MEDSPLEKLPPEVRSEIYKLALTQTHPIYLKCTERFSGPRSFYPRNVNTLALARTCKAIARECTQLFYAVNTFTLYFNTHQPIHQLNGFLKKIGKANAFALRKVILNRPSWNPSVLSRTEMTSTKLVDVVRAIQHDLVTDVRCDFLLYLRQYDGFTVSEVEHCTIKPLRLEIRGLKVCWESLFDTVKDTQRYEKTGRLRSRLPMLLNDLERLREQMTTLEALRGPQNAAHEE